MTSIARIPAVAGPAARMNQRFPVLGKRLSPIFPWVFTRAGAKQGLREALSAFAQVDVATI